MSGKKRFKKTQFGKRALAGAKSGTGGIKNPDGTRSSVLTATFDIEGPKGRTDVMVAPTIRKIDGKLKKLSAREAGRIAVQTGDFVRVKGGKTKKSIEEARAKGDRKSQKFSRRLGRISSRLDRERKIAGLRRRLAAKSRGK